MGELCEIHAQRLMTLLICGKWRFVALRDGAVIAASPAFWSSGGAVARTDREEAALGRLLDDLARRGWHPCASDRAAPGRPWYGGRLHRDADDPPARGCRGLTR